MDFKFRTTGLSRVHITDLAQYIKAYVAEYRQEPFSLWVGCDSLPKDAGWAEFGIAIVLYRYGKGAHIVGTMTREYHRDDFKRLSREVEIIIEMATYFRDTGTFELPNIVEYDMHLDFNKEKEFKSNEMYDWAIGWVRGCGFPCTPKPEAYAASYAADKIVRREL